LESDRDAVNIVEASVRGLVDYREAQLDDPAWWRRLRAIISTMERDRTREAIRTTYDFRLALVANSGLTEDSWNKLQDLAEESRVDIISTLRPWEGKSYQDRKQKEFKSWRQRYIDSFGVDPADPKFKEWEANAISELQETIDTEETDDQRVVRLLHERIEQGR
jgi:hypothetical protein